jgi:hypothetical protein
VKEEMQGERVMVAAFSSTIYLNKDSENLLKR